ncbi:hypothetical protein RRG08_062871 [Elysia crispata]|uniref:Uncharacterized protein n=1 Tax=Elysia crispata TaxID=231223 RepID=A0AAE1DDP5_9GAST|nr:hypothetical protein RRG08_062871 [Elysia crispata]
MDPNKNRHYVRTEYRPKIRASSHRYRNSETDEKNRPASQQKMLGINYGNGEGTDVTQDPASVGFAQNIQAAGAVGRCGASNSLRKVKESLTRSVDYQVPTVGQKLITAAKTGNLPELNRLLQQQQSGSEYFVVSQAHLNVSLLEACKEGRKFIVQRLVRSGAEVNVRGNKRCTTPLHIAAEQGFVDIADFLLDKEADVDAKDHHENSALILAVNRAGSSDMLNLLLVHEANVHHKNSQSITALMKAVEVMDIDAVKILISAGSDLKQKNRVGETALDIAVRLGISDVFDSLQSEEEDRFYHDFDWGSKLRCALSKAALKKDTEAVKILLDYRYIETEDESKKLLGSKKAKLKAKVAALMELIKSICSDAKKNKDLDDAKLELVKILIESGIDAEKTQQRSSLSEISSALIDATESGVFELVELLCNIKDIEINYNGSRQSALMKASEIGRVDLVKLLLKFGADPKKETYRGEIALTSALRNGHIRCANALLQEYKPSEKKLQEIVRLEMRDGQLESLKFLSSQCNVDEISQSLVETGIQTGDTRIVQFLVDHGADINKPCRGTPALLIAVENRKDCNMLDMVTLLVENGACVNRIPRYKTPLVAALENKYCHLDVIQYLLEKGADVNEYVDHTSRTPLAAALTRYSSFSGKHFVDQSLMEVLLKAGADPNRRERSGSTALHIAVLMNDLGSIKQLLDAGADLEARDSNGFTPMLQAVRDEQVKVVKLLKERGASIKAVDKEDKNAVFHSVESYCDRKKKILKLVASDKDQVNLQLPDGQTPLILAAVCGDARAVKILLEAGADPHKRNKQQKTALSKLVPSLRYKSGAMSKVKTLIMHGALLTLPKLSSLGLYSQIMDDERELVQLMVTKGMAPMCVDFMDMKPPVSMKNDDDLMRDIFGFREASECIENFSDSVWRNLSPLAAALAGHRLVIARYLVENWFLTPADLVGSDQLKDIRNTLKSGQTSEVQKYLDEYMSQPMSLVQLSFVAVSAQLGETIGREERVRKTPLPTGLQDRLLFKIENCSMDFSGVVKDQWEEKLYGDDDDNDDDDDDDDDDSERDFYDDGYCNDYYEEHIYDFNDW